MAATEPIRDKNQLKAMATYFLQRGQLRNYVLLNLGVHTALRISDLLRLRWEDVYDDKAETFRSHITLTEQKTGKDKTIALNKQVINALRLYFPYRRGAFIFASRKGTGAISRVQAWRIIHGAAAALGLVGHISCHSLRKTWGYHAWTSQAATIQPLIIVFMLFIRTIYCSFRLLTLFGKLPTREDRSTAARGQKYGGAKYCVY